MNSLILICLLLVLCLESTVAFRMNSGRMGINRVFSRQMSASEPWPLKTVSEEKLMGVVSDAICKQLEDVTADKVTLGANLIEDFDADSVDVVSILLALEGSFKAELTATQTKLPMDKLSSVHTVKDLVDVMVGVMKEVESKQAK